MSKIVIFTGALTSGGAERVISLLSDGFLSFFKEVEIVTYYDRSIWYDIDSRVKITSVEGQCANKSIIGRTLWFRKYIKKSKPSAVISFLAPFNIICLISLLGTKTKVVVADRNDPTKVPSKKIIRFVRNMSYRLADMVIVQTLSNKMYFSKAIHNKIRVIPNPIILSNDLAQAFTTEKSNRIVTVGRLVHQKNHKLLIDSLEQLKKDYPDLKLDIYGEGPLEQSLNEYIAEKDLCDNIILRGVSNNVHKDILDANCFVLSSLYEGMPNALIEAMCLGIPCVSTEVSGARDLIETGINGILIKGNSVDSLVAGIKTILDDPINSLQIGRNAYQLREILDFDKILDLWVNLLNEILVD